VGDVLNQLTDTVEEGDLSSLTDLDKDRTGHPPSERNRAAYAALLSEGESKIDIFRQVNAEISVDGSSVTEDSILEDATKESFGAAKSAATDFLTDPNFTDSQKEKALLAVLDKENSKYNSTNMLSTKQAVVDVPGESLEDEIVRINVTSRIDEINEYKKKTQELYNAERVKVSNDGMSLFLDAIEFLLPQNEQQRANNVRNAIINKGLLDEETQGDISGLFSLLGNLKGDMRDVIKNLPPEERFGIAEALVKIVNESDSIVMSDKNDFSRVEFLKVMLEEGYYGEGSEVIDNIVSVLDIVGIGSLFGKGVAKGRKVFKNITAPKYDYDDYKRAWELRFGTKTAQPASVAENVKEVNPSTARAIHEAARVDESGEFAEATYGTSREEALAGDMLPEVITPDGRVRNRTHNPEAISNQELTPDQNIMDIASKDGGIYYWESEKKQMRAHSFKNFQEVKGVTLRGNMSQVGEDPSGGTIIKAVYGGENGGSTSAQSIFNRTKAALASTGVRDDEIKILKRNLSDGEYYPVKGIPEEPGDYLAQVDYHADFNPLGVERFADADVKRNVIDRAGIMTGGRSGSLQQHVLESASMLHPNLTFGANVAVDRVAGLEGAMLEVGKKFGDAYNSLPNHRRAKVEQYIKEANHRGIEFSEARLRAEAFSDKEIQSLKDWKTYWDSMYWLENRDLAKTMRARGFSMYEDVKTDSRFFAKELNETQAKQIKEAYDPQTGTVRAIDDGFHESDGILAKLRSPEEIDGQTVTHIRLDNASEAAKLRGIRDTDKILNYRHGYYSVNYKAPKFVVERVKDSSGNVLYEKAVAVAGDTPSAQRYADSLAKQGRGGEYFVRSDKKAMRMDSDDYWDLQGASGRLAQRARGKRLADASGPATVGSDQSFVMGPVDSMIYAARSTSKRVAMRDYLEATKQRFLQQFEEVLDKRQGMTQWPKDAAEIKDTARIRGVGNKKMGDAITTFTYIKKLEDGFRNAIDDSLQASLRGIADIAGQQGFGKLERGLQAAAEQANITAKGKNAAFFSYLATNPFRQGPLQAHQATLLAVNFPKYVLSQQMARDVIRVARQISGADDIFPKVGAKTPRDLEVDQMAKEFRDSGLLSSVDKQNLVEGALTELSEQTSRFGKNPVTRSLGKTSQAARRIGFDAGEIFNVMTSWLAHRDQMVRKVGRTNLTQAELDLVTGKARNYTYNMNAAGDMPYNQNALALAFQFMQVPHKALLQMVNRGLTRTERAKLLAYQVPMFTLPAAAMYDIFGEENLPKNPEAREAVVDGLEAYTFNKMASLIAGEDSRTDFGGLSPLDMHGPYTLVRELFSGNIGALYTESPSGKLLFGNSPRITNALKSIARLTGGMKDFETPTEILDTLHEVAKITSGYSNAYKARQAYKTGQIVHGSDVIDERVTSMESIFQLFGMPPQDVSNYWYTKNRLYEDSKEFEGDVKSWFRDLRNHLANKNIDMNTAEGITKSYGAAFEAFKGNEERAREIIDREIQKSIREKDNSFFIDVMRSAKWKSQEDVRTLLIALPNITEEERDRIRGFLDSVDKEKELETN
tara:strand:+ start:6615 stop:11276 length:4662 start_codon:yes stop_codon:yes gene_type:complete